MKIPVGREDFISLRKANSYYVDKTKLLYDLFEETDNVVTLFTRPRRFGKTLMLSMIESFFSIARKGDRDLFDGLAIMDYPKFCQENMNQYPVLFISLKDVEGLTFESALKMLGQVIARLCKENAELEFSEMVLPADAAQFHDLEYERAGIEQLKGSLITVMRMMKAVYDKPVILLIDEYDVPLAKANTNGYYRLFSGIQSVTWITARIIIMRFSQESLLDVAGTAYNPIKNKDWEDRTSIFVTEKTVVR